MKKIQGRFSTAETFDLAAIATHLGHPGLTVAESPEIEAWKIHAPWAHPVWHSYALLVYHLRPLPGLPPPKMYVTGATHEMVLFALNPDEKVPLDRPFADAFLHPMNFGAQFIAADDTAAARKVEECVRKITAGELSPDTDHLQSWIAIFNAGMVEGDPDRAGETRIITLCGDTTTEVVFDPKKAGERPKV